MLIATVRIGALLIVTLDSPHSVLVRTANAIPSPPPSTAWAATHTGSELQSSDCTENPSFCNATMVYIPYGSGDTHSGNHTEKVIARIHHCHSLSTPTLPHTSCPHSDTHPDSTPAVNLTPTPLGPRHLEPVLQRPLVLRSHHRRTQKQASPRPGDTRAAHRGQRRWHRNFPQRGLAGQGLA